MAKASIASIASRDSPAGLAALSREAIDAMLAFAIRAAAVTCSRVGPDLPFAHEL
ncbi:carbohydrate kinase, partial [Pseudomonas aeruginosa]